MTALALRIVFARRNSALSALAIRAVGMGLATLLLVLATSASGALEQRGDRTSWRDMTTDSVPQPEQTLHVVEVQNPYRDRVIRHVLVSQLAEDAPVPPGLPHVPAPGETFLSPAVEALIADDPALARRFSDGAPTGTIAKGGLADSGELLVVSGLEEAAMPEQGTWLGAIPTGYHQTGMTAFLNVLLIIGVVVLMLPVVLFIAAAARLDAQNSDARLAALRLAGADPRQVRWLVAIESIATGVPGALLGFATFFAIRPLIAQFVFDENRFYATDFAVGPLSFAVLVFVPLIAVAASFFGLRDVEISPLGVSRRTQKKAVRPYALPLLAGGFVVYWYAAGQTDGGVGASFLLILGIAAIMVGLALVGPWLGQILSRMVAARAGSGALLLASRRIVAEPHATFRTVSGVTFAVFAGTLFLSVTSAATREVERDLPADDRSEVFSIWTNVPGEGAPPPEVGPDARLVTARVLEGQLQGSPDNEYVSVVQGDCDLLLRVYAASGACQDGAAVLDSSVLAAGSTIAIAREADGQGAVPPLVELTIPATAGSIALTGFDFVPDVFVPPGTLAEDDFDPYRPAWVIPAGTAPWTTDQREAVRTSIIRAMPGMEVYSGSERRQFGDSIGEMRNLIYTAIFVTFAVSGATVALSVAGGIIARRQSFALLRLSGVSLGTLRRTVLTEATLPLLLVSGVSAGLAIVVAMVTIERAGTGSVLPPASFALPLAGGLAMGLVLTLSTLPLLGHVTSSERTRFE